MFYRVCTLWGHARRGVRVGEKLFPGFTGPGVTEKLGSAAGRCGWERAKRLGPRGIRRGAAQAILDAGGSIAQLLRARQWHSSADGLIWTSGSKRRRRRLRFRSKPQMVRVLGEGSEWAKKNSPCALDV